MLNWSIEKITLQLKYTWKISRNASDEKINFIISVSDDEDSGSGEAAPNIRYHETPDLLEKQFSNFLKHKPEDVQSLDELSDLLLACSVKGALRFAIESAYIHYICKKQNSRMSGIPDYFGLKPVDGIPISYSIPIMDIGQIKSFYKENKLERFRFIKLKVNSEEAFETIKHLASFCDSSLMIDANEAFTNVEQCILFLEKLKKFPIEFVEQPMPASSTEESLYLKKYSQLPLFADESVIDEADFTFLRHAFNGVNVKLMKAGGYVNAIKQLTEAKANNLKTMIGCMVETTLGISGGLNLCSLADYADLDSFLTIKNEPFGLLKEENGTISFSNVML